LHPGEELVLFRLAGDLHALEPAAEPDIDVQFTSILVEVQECPAGPPEVAAPVLAQLREPSQLDQQRLYPVKVFRRGVPHASSMTLGTRTAQAPARSPARRVGAPPIRAGLPCPAR
jgi:hypothetical protein